MNGIISKRRDGKIFTMQQGVDSQKKKKKAKDGCKCGHSANPRTFRSVIECANDVPQVPTENLRMRQISGELVPQILTED